MKRICIFILALFICLLTLSGYAEDVFEIKDGINISDTRSDVKRKETLPFKKDANEYTAFEEGKSFGIELSGAEYKFDGNEKIIYALFTAMGGDRTEYERNYETIRSEFINKYGEPSSKDLVPTNVYLPAYHHAVNNINMGKLWGSVGKLFKEEYWIIPSSGVIIDMVTRTSGSSEDDSDPAYYFGFGFTYDKSVLNISVSDTSTSKAQNTDYDFKQFIWGDTKDYVISIEGTPDVEGEYEGTDNIYIGYKKEVMGIKCILGYYFGSDGLNRVRYVLQEDHTNNSLFIDDYNKFKKELTKKYGEPKYDNEYWSDKTYEEIYSDKKGDGLRFGYLAYETGYDLSKTSIYMSMNSDNYEVTTIIEYKSKVNIVVTPDYSDQF